MTPPTTNANSASGRRVPRSEQDLETRMAKALAHPLRARVLTRLNDRVASPNELSRELNEPLGNVSYHVKALLELGCIELVDTAQRRGAIEHYYRALTRAALDEGAWKQLPASVRSEMAGNAVEDIIKDVSAAFKAGTVTSRPEHHVSWTRLVLDEQGWKELNEQLLALLDRAMELQSESAGRLQADQAGGEEVVTSLSMLSYESAPPSS